MIGIRSKGLNRLGVAAQLNRYHDPGLAELRDQPAEETPGCLCIAVGLNQNVEHISVAVNRSPEPVFHTANDNHHLIKMPLVIWFWSAQANAAREMPAKPVHPVADRFPADTNAPLRQKVFNICRAQSNR